MRSVLIDPLDPILYVSIDNHGQRGHSAEVCKRKR